MGFKARLDSSSQKAKLQETALALHHYEMKAFCKLYITEHLGYYLFKIGNGNFWFFIFLISLSSVKLTKRK